MLDVVRFLAEHVPFRGLDADVVADIAGSIQVEFFDRGVLIIEQGGPVPEFVHVIRRGSVEMLDGERIVDILTEGDLFGFPSLLSGVAPALGVRSAEETLCYLIDGEHARAVFSHPSGMRFLTVSLRDRPRSEGPQPLAVASTVAEVAAGPLVSVTVETAVADVARRLTEVGATAAVVTGGGRVGIITDRDMRARVVAEGLAGTTPAGQIATTPARTVSADESLDRALVSMLSLGVHHLPVVADGAVVGMLTDLDLLGHQRRDAFRLRSDIERAVDLTGAVEAGRRIPTAVLPLVRAGVDAAHVGVVMATLVDALVMRLLTLGETELGSAPGPYGWLALGSGGRREQALHTDQDHALVYADTDADTDAEHDDYYRRLAEFVVDGLAAAGIPRCESKVMASEEGWRGPLAWWRRRIEEWMEVPAAKATFLTGIVFDARVVAGDLDLEALFVDAVERAAASPRFQARLGQLIVAMDVPIGFLGNLIVSSNGEHGTLDIKRGGLHPITEMARLHALRGGVRAVSTPRRLDGAARAGSLDPETAEALREAHALMRDLRLVHQTERFVAGEMPDDLIDPAALSPIERRSLRDAFRVVRDAQRSLAEELAPRVRAR